MRVLSLKPILYIMCMLLVPCVSAQRVDVQSDTWVCHDGLGRLVASADRGVTIQEIDTTRQVGMFYYVWHGQHGKEFRDVTRLLNEEGASSPTWGGVNQYHWGGKPALGFYEGGDRFIIAKHMQMLADAGVDFYFFDVTNAFIYNDQVKAVMDEVDRRHALGLRVPKLVFCCHTGSGAVVTQLYEKWYSNPANNKYWFYWNGKPLILVDMAHWGTVVPEIQSKFTPRHCWAWEEGEGKWPWLAFYPQKHNFSNETGKTVYEQMTVASAMHPYSKIGKSYCNGKEPEIDSLGLTERTPYGDFFQEQFNQALKERPRVLMLTQWNEWIAMRFLVSNEESKPLTRPGVPEKVGESYFVDVYNQEFNRDIEPSAEPLIRDNYYLQMVSNLRKYKGARPIPAPSAYKKIKLNGNLSQWEDVQPEYLDEPGDIYYTSAKAQSEKCLKRKGNDIVSCRVASDKNNVYFMSQVDADTMEQAEGAEDATFMTLLLNTDTAYTSGWEGYDYMVTKTEENYWLYRWEEKTSLWSKYRKVNGEMGKNYIVYALRRKDINLRKGSDLDFKWVDNTPAFTTEILDFIVNGDAAPNGRFNYRFKGSKQLD